AGEQETDLIADVLTELSLCLVRQLRLSGADRPSGDLDGVLEHHVAKEDHRGFQSGEQQHEEDRGDHRELKHRAAGIPAFAQAWKTHTHNSSPLLVHRPELALSGSAVLGAAASRT